MFWLSQLHFGPKWVFKLVPRGKNSIPPRNTSHKYLELINTYICCQTSRGRTNTSIGLTNTRVRENENDKLYIYKGPCHRDVCTPWGKEKQLSGECMDKPPMRQPPAQTPTPSPFLGPQDAYRDRPTSRTFRRKNTSHTNCLQRSASRYR